MGNRILTLSDFDFDLPDELVAQYPDEKRDHSRLLVLDRRTGGISHRIFRDIVEYLGDGDVMVFNDVRVLHARIFFFRETGGLVEMVLTERLGDRSWRAISNRTARLKTGEVLKAKRDPSVSIRIAGRLEEAVEIETSVPLDEGTLEKIGVVPLPPYIRREATDVDGERYQTVYARQGGAVASPTAGLHFTAGLLDTLRSRGVQTVNLTLHVSWGTFQPVRSDNLSLHSMHEERYELPADAADTVNGARSAGGRIIAVGTTSLRVLETTFIDGRNVAGNGSTRLFVRPPMEVRSAGALITNFHTPRSTLLMLVAAFAGYDRIMAAYREAVRMRYRFFSYGDAMMIL